MPLRHDDRRILVIDDYPDNVFLLERLLTRHDLGEVTGVTDPRLVMGRLDEFDPDLILLDLHMPHIDGHTLLRHLRSWSGDTYLPVIVLTADTSPETLLRTLDDGATDFLTKPFNATEIVIRVRNLLQTRSLYLRLRELQGPGCPTGR
jgi:PleD family two-component response regulator